MRGTEAGARFDLSSAGGLRLRPLAPSDAAELHALWTAPGVRRYLWDDEIIPEARTEEIVSTSAGLFERDGFGLWSARDPQDGALIGFGGFWHFREPPILELLYGVAEPHWTRGHATDIGRGIMAYGFETLRMPVIRASTDEGNIGSVRVLQKLGFAPTLRAAIAGRVTLFFECERG